MKKGLKKSAFLHKKASKNVKLWYGCKAGNLFPHSKKRQKIDITSTGKRIEKKASKICNCSFLDASSSVENIVFDG